MTNPVLALNLPQKVRVPNRSPGYCAWACLETLGNYHKIEALYNLVDKRTRDNDVVLWTVNGWKTRYKHIGYISEINSKLTSLKVAYASQRSGNFSDRLLKYADRYGCMVCVRKGALYEEDHAVLLTKYNSEIVNFYDPNTGKIMTASRQWFDHWWDGMVVLVWNRKTAGKQNATSQKIR